MKIKYTEIFLLPLLMLILMSFALFYNLQSIQDREETLKGLPNGEELAKTLISSEKELTKASIIEFSRRIEALAKDTLEATLESMKTTRDIFIFILVVVVVWLFNSLKLYKKLKETKKL